MSDRMARIRSYEADVADIDMHGFELLQTLDNRSKLATEESEMTPEERQALERADAVLLRNARALCANISQVASLPEMRQNANALPSHWWWYLDVITEAVGERAVA